VSNGEAPRTDVAATAARAIRNPTPNGPDGNMNALRTYGWFALAGLSSVAALGLMATESPWAIAAQLVAVLAVCGGLIQRNTLQGALVTTAAAVVMNGYLLQRKIDASSGSSACAINAVFDCDKVNTSPWSMIGTVPVTLLGLAGYGGLLAALLLAPNKPPKRSPDVDRLIVGFAAPSFAFSLFLGYQSKVVGAFCLVCLSIYAATALLLWAGLRGLKLQQASFSEGMALIPFRREGLVFAGVGVVVLSYGHGAYQDATRLPTLPFQAPKSPGDEKPADPIAELATLYSAAKKAVVSDGTEAILGPKEARFHVFEFADFGCPHCAEAEKELTALLAAQADVAVHFKAFPLSGVCNPVLADPRRTETSDPRCDAALAAECANQQGKFGDFAHLLFANQGGPEAFAKDNLTFFAKQVGLDLAAWENCNADPATLARVKARAQEGGDAGVMGTPTLFVDGLIPGEQLRMERGTMGLKLLLEAARQGVTLQKPAGPGR
jgi:protein-disulfide isomerase/uncharacterized membrane protein